MTLLEFSDNLKRRSTYLKIFTTIDNNDELLFEGTASMLSHSVFMQKNSKLVISVIYFDERTYMIMVNGDIK